ncbi:hypothetical protein DPMN_097695 [Dreissena polymorpha]|uniref:Uncharacterized protein n=1 Tax=Dreissena polymorpha TaxID=45954 RepID=A0A9D4R4Z2_DREPO|nr:hypothetical protein DPMN_097695 [Dreissena polymorpha]
MADETSRRFSWLSTREFYGKLLQSINTMREAKNEKMTIGENSVGVNEVAKSVNDVFEID